jgi:hypothetical protein
MQRKEFARRSSPSSTLVTEPLRINNAVMPRRIGSTFCAVLALVLPTENLVAERNQWKPADFEPLTSLPWKWPGATLESVLTAIFREPNPAIRYPVLGEYLRTIPVAQLGKAFDLCIDLEGEQTPDFLVGFFLPIWSKRDPKACWKRTRELFRLVGIEEGWLNLDSWKDRPRIAVQDRAAINVSRFWLEQRGTLLRFAEGLDESALSRTARVQMMREFTDVWFTRFGSWPANSAEREPWNPDLFTREILKMFDAPLDWLPKKNGSGGGDLKPAPAFEVALRRLLEAKPEEALQIVERARETKWPPSKWTTKTHSAGPTTELLMIWARVDLLAISRWAEGLDSRNDPLAPTAKGFLMSRVDEETRNRWRAEAKAADPENGTDLGLLEDWAQWEPKSALDAAIATGDAETIQSVAQHGAYGPWTLPLNTSHHGLGVIKEFDVASLPDELRKEVIREWGITIMEQWGDIDIREAARYGLDFMLRNDYAPRENLIKLFSGDDKFSSDSDMIDRTFCALRVWAVVKPREMKAWIGTIKEADMRKALTWLLDHPWGTGPEK